MKTERALQYAEVSRQPRTSTQDALIQRSNVCTSVNAADCTYLSCNAISSGEIPLQVLSFPSLQTLELEYANLQGTIPSFLANLKNLSVLKLGNNALRGSIPSELGLLTNLRVLELHRNKLTGTIPETLSNLKNLENLTLSFNQLSGSLPKFLGSLPALSLLYAQNNLFQGRLPAGLLSPRSRPWQIAVYNTGLSGNIDEFCGALVNPKRCAFVKDPFAKKIHEQNEFDQYGTLKSKLYCTKEGCGKGNFCDVSCGNDAEHQIQEECCSRKVGICSDPFMFHKDMSGHIDPRCICRARNGEKHQDKDGFVYTEFLDSIGQRIDFSRTDIPVLCPVHSSPVEHTTGYSSHTSLAIKSTSQNNAVLNTMETREDRGTTVMMSSTYHSTKQITSTSKVQAETFSSQPEEHDLTPPTPCKDHCQKPDHVGDGICDDVNNNCACEYDGGDCCGESGMRHQWDFCRYCLPCLANSKIANAALSPRDTVSPTLNQFITVTQNFDSVKEEGHSQKHTTSHPRIWVVAAAAILGTVATIGIIFCFLRTTKSKNYTAVEPVDVYSND